MTGYHKIGAKEAQQMLQTPGCVLVDVRTPEEYRQAHIPGALLIPNDEISRTAGRLLPDKDAAILMYCRSGSRSWSAAHRLAALGYTNVYDFGGIVDWPYGTVSGK